MEHTKPAHCHRAGILGTELCPASGWQCRNSWACFLGSVAFGVQGSLPAFLARLPRNAWKVVLMAGKEA